MRHTTFVVALGACAASEPDVEIAMQPLCESGGDCCPSPIIIDVAGDGIRLTGWRAGVTFELAPGIADSALSWTEPGSDDAWLVMDRDGDGAIRDGTEMFGNFTPQPPAPRDHKNGFAALATYDANGDGRIDGSDPQFRQLRLWQDEDHDGVAQSDELHPLLALGVAGIGVGYREESLVDEHGNGFRFSAPVYGTPGSPVGMMAWDVFLHGMRPAGGGSPRNHSGGSPRNHGGGMCPGEDSSKPNLYPLRSSWPLNPTGWVNHGQLIEYNFLDCNSGVVDAPAHTVRMTVNGSSAVSGPFTCANYYLNVPGVQAGACVQHYYYFEACTRLFAVGATCSDPSGHATNYISLKTDSGLAVAETSESDNTDTFGDTVTVLAQGCIP